MSLWCPLSDSHLIIHHSIKRKYPFKIHITPEYLRSFFIYLLLFCIAHAFFVGYQVREVCGAYMSPPMDPTTRQLAYLDLYSHSALLTSLQIKLSVGMAKVPTHITLQEMLIYHATSSSFTIISQILSKTPRALLIKA